MCPSFAMAFVPSRVEEWFQQIPHLILEEGSLCSSFFEASNAPKDLSDATSTRSSWQRLSRDFPEEGD
eukprot:Skav217865  [mRNA]  locus=scaffold2487:25329:30778:+ [translate_table: standard]